MKEKENEGEEDGQVTAERLLMEKQQNAQSIKDEKERFRGKNVVR